MIYLENVSFRSAVNVPPSKSYALRSLILSALSDAPVNLVIRTSDLCDDIKHGIECIKALGASCTVTDSGICVVPPDAINIDRVELDCGESATLFRIMKPLCRNLGIDADFIVSGSLVGRKSEEVFDAAGQVVSVDASLSSQYLSGELISAALTGMSVKPSGKTVSRPYIGMTLKMLEQFGAKNTFRDGVYTFQPVRKLKSPGTCVIEADYSSAAVPLTAGIIGKSAVTCRGLSSVSVQGDRRITDILQSMGGNLIIGDDFIAARPSVLHPAGVIDITDCPDLAPAVFAACAVCSGKTVITGTERLHNKECDRAECLTYILNSAGIRTRNITVGDSEAVEITGGTVHPADMIIPDDHRMAMVAVLLSVACNGRIGINSLDSLSKSWPSFMNNITTEA